MKRIEFIILIFAGTILGGCEYEFPVVNENYDSGNTDMSSYISLGDEISSGFMDGALYTAGQINSYPAILARQFQKVDNTTFNQPSIASENGYNTIESDGSNTFGRYIYKFNSPSDIEPTKTTTAGEEVADFTGNVSELDDFTVPFLKSFNINRPELSENPYYERFASNPGVSTLLDDALTASPTFFTLNLGFSDIYNYAMKGAVGIADPPSDPALIGDDDLTPASLFESVLTQVLTELLSNSVTKGAIANIPNIQDVPFFYIFPYNFIKLNNLALGTANLQFNPFNDGVAWNNQQPENSIRPYISFNDNGLGLLYPQPLVVNDSTLPDATYENGDPLEKYRQLKEDELVLYSLDESDVDAGLGWVIPLPHELYLTKLDLEIIQIRINAFNNIIQQAVDDNPNRLVLVDLNTLYHKYAPSSTINAWGSPLSDETFDYEGIPINFNIEMNGVFSLDAMQFNARGNALIANEFVRSINQAFGANIPSVDINEYLGNTFVE